MIRTASDTIGTALHDLLDLGAELVAAAALLADCLVSDRPGTTADARSARVGHGGGSRGGSIDGRTDGPAPLSG